MRIHVYHQKRCRCSAVHPLKIIHEIPSQISHYHNTTRPTIPRSCVALHFFKTLRDFHHPNYPLLRLLKPDVLSNILLHRHRLVILILHPPPTLAIPEAAPATRAPLAPEVRRLGAALVLARAAADAEEDGGEQKAGHGGPGEAVAVPAQLRTLAVAAEDVAAFDGPGTKRKEECC